MTPLTFRSKGFPCFMPALHMYPSSFQQHWTRTLQVQCQGPPVPHPRRSTTLEELLICEPLLRIYQRVLRKSRYIKKLTTFMPDRKTPKAWLVLSQAIALFPGVALPI